MSHHSPYPTHLNRPSFGLNTTSAYGLSSRAVRDSTRNGSFGNANQFRVACNANKMSLGNTASFDNYNSTSKIRQSSSSQSLSFTRRPEYNNFGFTQSQPPVMINNHSGISLSGQRYASASTERINQQLTISSKNLFSSNTFDNSQPFSLVSSFNQKMIPATSLEKKTLCPQHNFLNDFYCIQCNREICSHCLFMATSPHQTHDTVRLREYLTGVLQKNKDFSRLCDLVKQKYNKPKNPSRIRNAIRENEAQFAHQIDGKLNDAIVSLKKLQNQIKKSFTTMLITNIDQIENTQQSLIKKSKRGETLSYALERSAESNNLKEISVTARSIDQAFIDLNQAMTQYEEVKKECTQKRENYVAKVNDGVKSILELVSQKVASVSNSLGIQIHTTIIPEIESSEERVDTIESLCLGDLPLKKEELVQARKKRRPETSKAYQYLQPEIIRKHQTFFMNDIKEEKQQKRERLTRSRRQSRLICDDSIENITQDCSSNTQPDKTPRDDEIDDSEHVGIHDRTFGREIHNLLLSSGGLSSNALDATKSTIQLHASNRNQNSKNLSSKYYNRDIQ